MKGVSKKLNLPLFSDPAIVATPTKEVRKKPSIDAARARLGGRVNEIDTPPAGFAPGVLVTFPVGSPAARAAGDDRRMHGVVVFASQNEVHVLLDGVRLRRLPPSDVTIHEGGEVAIELEKIAGDARLFGQLVEGQSVRYADDSGGLVNGKVVEKCRWGALVLREDGAVVAVGFRKLWPSPTGASA
ncbi:MAG: hypothetical protein BGO98_18670 [Myxococcales bacterium 68-20]|nr:MAG: hypothetical protein BGO98_18670 [Myxococcales bacterium 68-20]